MTPNSRPPIPIVPAETRLREITVRGTLLGAVLATLLAASTVYLGLKIGRTVAGSIPAAIVSMAVVRWFRNSNILENNMVQTIASAGEVVASGSIFVLPALIIMGHTQHFDYKICFLVLLIGSVLGVLLSVPLRRVMIVEARLPFPEGVATAAVLKAGDSHGTAIRSLSWGGAIAVIIAWMQIAFKTATETIGGYIPVLGGKTVIGCGLALSPVLIGAGYIVGIEIGAVFVIGAFLNNFICLPIYGLLHGTSGGVSAVDAAAIWQSDALRYAGVGMLAVGGIWNVIAILPQMARALQSSLGALKNTAAFASINRLDSDLSANYLCPIILLVVVPLSWLIGDFLLQSGFSAERRPYWVSMLFSVFGVIILSFMGAAIAAYLVGLAGSTSMPLSGIAIAVLFALGIPLQVYWGDLLGLIHVGSHTAAHAAAYIVILATIIAVACSLSGDNLQDLKAGQIVGSTPWKQQLMLLIGAVVASALVPFALQMVYEAYGMGPVVPREGMSLQNTLPAPQATLMAAVAQGLFNGLLPWGMIRVGGLIAVAVIVCDWALKRRKSHMRLPVLAVALGFYLPAGYIVAFFIGGLINWIAHRHIPVAERHKPTSKEPSDILFASGVIAGEAILGALLAIPFSVYQSADIFAMRAPWVQQIQLPLGLALFAILLVALYRFGKNSLHEAQR